MDLPTFNGTDNGWFPWLVKKEHHCKWMERYGLFSTNTGELVRAVMEMHTKEQIGTLKFRVGNGTVNSMNLKKHAKEFIVLHYAEKCNGSNKIINRIINPQGEVRLDLAHGYSCTRRRSTD